jgi:probable O-glycosylation ligase (exosortase A-associated)
MRDLALFGLVFGLVPVILFRPYIGVLTYVWISVMNPHRLTWGYAYDFGFAVVVGAATLVGAMLTKRRSAIPVNSLSIALAAFLVWTSITTILSLYPGESAEKWVIMIKTMFIVLMIPVLLQTREQFRLLIWVIVLSLAYYGAKGGLFVLMTGGEFRVWGPTGSYIQDNNALAAALVMIVPMMRYLQLTSPYKLVRWGLLAMMILCAIAVFGSYSRGALLAVTAMLAFLWLKGRHKLAFIAVGIISIPIVLSVMPERWYQRMETIGEYQVDSSASMRLNSWGTMLNIAKDRPILGAGYEVAKREIYNRYSPDPSFPPQVAHSIYFEALGSHGFVGLAIYLALLFCHWRTASHIVSRAGTRPDLAWARQYGLMMQVSIVGFAVGGAFLSLMLFDVPYYLIGATLVVSRFVDDELKLAEPVREGPDATPPIVPVRQPSA